MSFRATSISKTQDRVGRIYGSGLARGCRPAAAILGELIVLVSLAASAVLGSDDRMGYVRGNRQNPVERVYYTAMAPPALPG
jgi:hypothetical protein